jgi:hypothetical protein
MSVGEPERKTAMINNKTRAREMEDKEENNGAEDEGNGGGADDDEGEKQVYIATSGNNGRHQPP